MARFLSGLVVMVSLITLSFCKVDKSIIEMFQENIVAETQSVRDSIRPSLLKSVPSQFHNKKISDILPQEKIQELETFIKNVKIDMNDQVAAMMGHRILSTEDLQVLKNLVLKEVNSHLRSEFGRGGLIAFIEALMKGMMTALQLDFKDVFIALVNPLIDLTILLNPLPEYQYTNTVMDGDQEMRYIEETFDNWGYTLLANVTVRTFFPRTVKGIQNIVKDAVVNGARVRASATRHTFNPWLWGVESNLQPGTAGQNVDYVIAMLPLEISDHLAYARDHGSWPEDSELVFIEGPLDIWEEEGKKHASVKFGPSTLNLHYYDWALANNWTMPANTIMHYMSIGGVAMGTCHGGGIGHQTLADRILEMEYVDSLGEVQVINDPEMLKVVGGSMGMLGIVTSITYRLDEMTYARFWPQHIPGGLESILPPPGEDIPEQTLVFLTNYYSESIQYPHHHGAPGILWMNSWDNLGNGEDALSLIDHKEDEFQRSYIFLEDVANRGFKTIFEYFDSTEYLYWLFGWLVGAASSIAMNDWDAPVTTTATEAMHFQRGLHYLSVKTAELIVPIPELENGEPDWRILQEVVFDMQQVYNEFIEADLYPMDLAMENRMMAGSDMLMAAQYGNKRSLAIEIASSPLVPEDLWLDFKNALATKWKNYYDREGNRLKVRPHWAKEFPQVVGDQDIYEYMREVYADQIPAYVEGVKKLMKQTNGNLTHTIKTFSTKYLDTIFEGYF